MQVLLGTLQAVDHTLNGRLEPRLAGQGCLRVCVLGLHLSLALKCRGQTGGGEMAPLEGTAERQEVGEGLTSPSLPGRTWVDSHTCRLVTREM